MEADMEIFTQVLAGEFADHVYVVSEKSISDRMKIFTEQLIPDMLTNELMTYSEKVVSYNFVIRKTETFYMKGVKSGMCFEETYDFKHAVRTKLYHLLFRNV